MATGNHFLGLFVWLAGVALALAQSGQYGASLVTNSAELFAAPPQGRDCPGRRTVQAPASCASNPSELPDGVAWFDTWVARLNTSSLSESVYADFHILDREWRRTVIERFIRDYFRHIYVSYLLTVEWLPDLHSLRVTFSDAAGPPPDNLPPKENWLVTSPAPYLAPQIVKWGDEISVHLATAEKGVELIDYIQFARKGKIEPRISAPKDFYDETAEFTLKSPRLRVNGATQNSTAFPDTVQGTMFWIYVPGHGRYVLTFSPHPELGLERVGELTGNHMIVAFGGNLYRVDCRDRIAAGSGVYNVYGFRDANWKPPAPKNGGTFMMGTSPSLATSLGR